MNKELAQKLNQLPTGWNELKLKDFNNLIHHLPSGTNGIDEMDSIIMILSILTNTPVDVIENEKVNDLLQYFNQLHFIYTDVQAAKVDYKTKDITAINYAEFQSWMQLANEPYKNINQLLPIFIPELENVDVNELPMDVITGCFFLLKKKLIKHLKHSKVSLNWKMLKMKLGLQSKAQ